MDCSEGVAFANGVLENPFIHSSTTPTLQHSITPILHQSINPTIQPPVLLHQNHLPGLGKRARSKPVEVHPAGQWIPKSIFSVPLQVVFAGR